MKFWALGLDPFVGGDEPAKDADTDDVEEEDYILLLSGYARE